MKINLNKNNQQFQPVNVVITIETEEELKAFKAMSTRNITIPNCVDNKGTPDWHTIQTFLDQLRNTLYGAT